MKTQEHEQEESEVEELSVNDTNIKDKIKVELGYGSDLYMDEEDEDKLNEMPDIQRENILFERNQKRLQLLERYELFKRQRLLSERQKLQQKFPKKKLIQVRYENYNDIKQQNFSQSDHPSQCSECSSSSSPSSSSKNSTSKVDEKQRKELTREQKLKEPSVLQDLLKVQSKREFIGQHLDSPCFQDLIKGTFVKVVAGNSYRVGEVVGIQKTQNYYQLQFQTKKVGKEQPRTIQISTSIELKCDFGKVQKFFKIMVVSNKDITEDEFKWLSRAYKNVSKTVPTKFEVFKKQKQMKLLLQEQSQLKSEQIEEIVFKNLEQKINKGDFRFNVSYEKSKLFTDIETLKEKILRKETKGQLRETILKQLNRLQALYEKIVEYENAIKKKTEDRERNKAQRKEDEDVEMIEESEEQTKLRSYLQQLQKADQKQEIQQEDLRLLPFNERRLKEKELYEDSFQNINLSIDEELQKDDFGIFFQKDIRIFEPDKFHPQINEHFKTMKIGNNSDNNEKKIKILTFDDYFLS